MPELVYRSADIDIYVGDDEQRVILRGEDVTTMVTDLTVSFSPEDGPRVQLGLLDWGMLSGLPEV